MTLSVPLYQDTRILVAGDVMLDRYWFGPASRVSPEAPVPVVHVEEAEERPGGAGNVAMNLASLGVETTLIGVTGTDDAGGRLESLLTARGIRCSFARDAHVPTITKLRVLSRNQQLLRLDFEKTPHPEIHAPFGEHFGAALGQADAVILSDYAKGALREAKTLIGVAREAGLKVFVDPKGRDFDRYRGATMLTPNQAELEEVVGVCVDDDQLVERGTALCRDLGLEALLITRSERGMTLVPAAGAPVHLGTQARELYDVTGAGDTVIALLAAGCAAGARIEDAAALANLGAGLVVRKLGVASVTRNELCLALHQKNAEARGTLTREQVCEFAREARERGEKVVMTNGCFDLLHAGHVAYLKEAKALGDRLVIAIHDDASVARLKGPGRPVNTLADRMAVLTGLAAVDCVVPFGEDTAQALIRDVLPDILVRGGDHRPEDVAGGECVRANGGEIRVLTHRNGRSTSSIIEAIRSQ